ncbi:TPA: hypothetical protein ACGUP9_000029 [Vibrio vulnificus]
MRSLSPKLSSRIAEIPYSVFATNVNNVSGYIAKYFTFDLRNDVKKGMTHGFMGFGGMTSDFVAIGRGKGDFADTLVFSFRGTQKTLVILCPMETLVFQGLLLGIEFTPVL